MSAVAASGWWVLWLSLGCAAGGFAQAAPTAPPGGPDSAVPVLGGFYKNLFAITDLRDNYQNLGLTDQSVALDDYQRFRLKFDYEPRDCFDLKLHYEARTAWGETARIRNLLRRFASIGPPGLVAFVSWDKRARFLNLESGAIGDSQFVFDHGLDRLQFRFRWTDYELSVGRQAVTWGPGLIWNPNDLFSGFSPTEIDRDEKFGVDVARFTWTPAFGTSLDLIAEPLDLDGPYKVDAEDSSLALRANAKIGEFELAVQGGAVAGDRVLGGDFTGYLMDAGLRGESTYVFVGESGERDYFRGMISLDYAFHARWNPYLAVEYFYNGLGTTDPDGYLSRLGTVSVRRAFQRGNAYNLGRHYMGVVWRFVPSGLVSLQSVTLWNMLDSSVREFAAVNWSLSDNLDFQLGIDLGLGKLGTEFSGYAKDQAGVDFRLPNFMFGFLKYYF